MTTWVGLDPSIAAFGYAVLGAEHHQPLQLLEVGTWKTKPEAGEQKRDDRARRVISIARELKALLYKHQPSVVAIESPVLGMRDGKVAVHIAARVRGMVEGLCVGFNFGMVEFTPQAVKKAIVGAHDASKAAVANALFAMGYKTESLDDNATDALAIAHIAARRLGTIARATPATYSADDLDF